MFVDGDALTILYLSCTLVSCKEAKPCHCYWIYPSASSNDPKSFDKVSPMLRGSSLDSLVLARLPLNRKSSGSFLEIFDEGGVSMVEAAGPIN